MQQFDDFSGQPWLARRGILHGKQLARETPKVMPGLGCAAAADQQLLAFPMRRYHHDRLWAGQLGRQALQRRAARAGLQGEHG
jgi:hypothetical protein